MGRINSIKINNVTKYLENIAYLDSLPVASEDSPDFVSVEGVLYAKTYIDSVYAYKNIAQSLTAGDNISISDDGIISVTGELGTQIEANPELTGDETKLSSISIDGVNYDILEGAAKAYVQNEEMLVIEEGDIHIIETKYIEQEVALLQEYVNNKIAELQESIQALQKLKQNKLTAGSNIIITEDDVISAISEGSSSYGTIPNLTALPETVTELDPTFVLYNGSIYVKTED